MEGLFIFIAMVVFIIRTVNKIKKAAGSGKKTGESGNRKPSSAMDKLEKLIRSMEEAERLKKEGEGGEAADSISPGPSIPVKESYGNKKTSVNKSLSGAPDDKFNMKFRNPLKETVFSEGGFPRYDEAERFFSGEDNYAGETGITEEDSAQEILQKTAGDLSRSGKISDTSELKSPPVYSGRDKKSILSSLSKYPELQRAVILKEIFDSPISGRN